MLKSEHTNAPSGQMNFNEERSVYLAPEKITLEDTTGVRAAKKDLHGKTTCMIPSESSIQGYQDFISFMLTHDWSPYFKKSNGSGLILSFRCSKCNLETTTIAWKTKSDSSNAQASIGK